MFHQLSTPMRRVVRSRARVVIISLAILVASAGPVPGQTREQPAACTDSTYVALKRQNPDSLSDRAWQRLQSLDRECVTARAQSQRMGSGMMGNGGHHQGTWLMGAIMTVMMVATIFRHW